MSKKAAKDGTIAAKDAGDAVENPESERAKAAIGVGEVEPSLEEVEEKLLAIKAKKEAELPICGHVNTHSRDLGGQPDNIACTRFLGHTGNHSALHLEWSIPPKPLSYDAKGRATPAREGVTHEVEVQWSDAAGANWPKHVPPSEAEIDKQLRANNMLGDATIPIPEA